MSRDPVGDSLTSFTVSDVEIAGANGQVTLKLLDGDGFAGSYRMSITPPGGSTLGVLFDQKMSLQAPPQIRLGSRRTAVTVRGKQLRIEAAKLRSDRPPTPSRRGRHRTSIGSTA